MRNAVILHGKPTRERYEDPNVPKPHEANWFPWITDQLKSEGIHATVPALPKPYYPVYEDWRRIFESEQIGPETSLVGHSAGAEFILRWLSTNPEAAAERVVLVAPYRDYEEKYGDFSKYKIDLALPRRVGALTLMSSLDDDSAIINRTAELIEAFPGMNAILLNGYGHFRIGHNMTSPEFPELLHELTS